MSAPRSEIPADAANAEGVRSPAAEVEKAPNGQRILDALAEAAEGRFAHITIKRAGGKCEPVDPHNPALDSPGSAT